LKIFIDLSYSYTRYIRIRLSPLRWNTWSSDQLRQQ